MSRFTSGPSGKKVEVFWGEIAPCEHMVQIYQDETTFLDTLEGFVAGGLRSGDGVIVIATSSHLGALEDRLRAAGLDVRELVASERYVGVSADQVLSTFMVNDWPDDVVFRATVGELLARAGRGGRRVRAFGEMVALLWGQGHTGATVRLEFLWHQMCRDRGFSLFCAYPRVGFTESAEDAMRAICAAHSRVIAN